MQINIQGHGLELSQPLRDYAVKKIGKLTEFFKNIQKIAIVLDARDIDEFRKGQVAEVTLWASGKKVIRATESGQDMYAAIDEVFAELTRQVKKHKEKRVHEVRREAEKFKQLTRTFKPQATPSAEPQLVKLKRFNISAMTQTEAAAEQTKLGHDFFLFRNAETGEINVLHENNVIDPSHTEKLTEEEAARRLLGEKIIFLAFTNAASNELNILYKRKSGNLGLIEPTL